METKDIFTVSDLTRYIKQTFEFDQVLQDVWIRGELSNFKLHSRGHMYFTVKDEGSRIQAVMFAGNNRFLKFRPEDGMKVLIRGSITVYEPYGQYQLYAKEMQPDGIGSLYLAFEELKRRLADEGLFLEEGKKKLPLCPTRVAIITSPTGAAIRDIVTTIKRRCPSVKLTLLPVLVQGEDAAPSIARAIRQANEVGMFDVIIVGRGGGSIEELWAFNEEIVAREIHASAIPIISAVGHETDITIADFVADVRAATPTAAAELAVPVQQEIYDRIANNKVRLIRALKEKVNREHERIQAFQKSYAFRYPQQLIKQKEQDLDRLIDRLEMKTKYTLARKRDYYTQLQKDLNRNHPKKLVDEKTKLLLQRQNDLKRRAGEILKDKSSVFQATISRLKLLSPLNVMERGYSIVYSDNNTLVKTIHQLEQGENVKIRLKDGSVLCQVREKEVNKNDLAEGG